MKFFFLFTEQNTFLYWKSQISLFGFFRLLGSKISKFGSPPKTSKSIFTTSSQPHNNWYSKGLFYINFSSSTMLVVVCFSFAMLLNSPNICSLLVFFIVCTLWLLCYYLLIQVDILQYFFFRNQNVFSLVFFSTQISVMYNLLIVLR